MWLRISSSVGGVIVELVFIMQHKIEKESPDFTDN
jgi:hypothetical protein